MEFTEDWFTRKLNNFEYAKTLISKVHAALEIGVYEGRATCWMLQNMISDTGGITCVDTFKGGEEHAGVDMAAVRTRFLVNTKAVKAEGQQCEVLENESHAVLAFLVAEQRLYDFIYVDGSHKAQDVLLDLCLAFRLLRPGGIMLCDDYLWGERENYPIDKRPKAAIDAFWAFHSPQAVICINANDQIGFIKRPS